MEALDRSGGFGGFPSSMKGLAVALARGRYAGVTLGLLMAFIGAISAHAQTATLPKTAPGAAKAAVEAVKGLEDKASLNAKKNSGGSAQIVGTAGQPSGKTVATVKLDGMEKTTNLRPLNFAEISQQLTASIGGANVSGSFKRAFGICTADFSGKAGVLAASTVKVDKLTLPVLELGLTAAATAGCGAKFLGCKVLYLQGKASAKAAIGVRPAPAGLTIESYSKLNLQGSIDGWVGCSRILDLDFQPLNREKIHRRVKLG